MSNSVACYATSAQPKCTQLHREPKGWRWPEDGPSLQYQVREPRVAAKNAALVLGLSATIIDDRITRVLGEGEDTAIWSITAERPHNDIIKRRVDLTEFRRLMRATLNAIKAVHGEDAIVNVFPALPISAAVEVGRVWMPKADLPLLVYDQNRKLDGFAPALEIID